MIYRYLFFTLTVITLTVSVCLVGFYFWSSLCHISGPCFWEQPTYSGQFGQGKFVCAGSAKENAVKNLTFVGNESALTEQSMGRHSKFSAGTD